jgi:hypothetical protein
VHLVTSVFITPDSPPLGLTVEEAILATPPGMVVVASVYGSAA